MKNLQGKKLLILGGSASTVNVVNYAKSMGAYVYVADLYEEGRPAKKIADKAVNIDATDYDALTDFVKQEQIDGCITSASEFHILNCIRLSEKAGLPFYTSEKHWNICQNKRHFKDLCFKYNVPCVPEFGVNDILDAKDFPVIVKPVDGCSSRGINICYNQEELEIAKKQALDSSPLKKILIERYIDNGGITLDAKYVAVDGEYYLEAFGENRVQGLITAIAMYPSQYIETFIKKVDPYVREMFKAIGYKNGAFFFQALPDGDNIYIYEMGLRVSGGMIYNITEATSGNNTLKMLINYSLTGTMCEKEDLLKIDPLLNGKFSASLSVPLKTGTIKNIVGLDIIEKMPELVDITQYYCIGDSITNKHINTLDQLFGRIILVANSPKELFEKLKFVRDTLTIISTENETMNDWKSFDKLYKEKI